MEQFKLRFWYMGILYLHPGSYIRTDGHLHATSRLQDFDAQSHLVQKAVLQRKDLSFTVRPHNQHATTVHLVYPEMNAVSQPKSYQSNTSTTESSCKNLKTYAQVTPLAHMISTTSLPVKANPHT